MTGNTPIETLLGGVKEDTGFSRWRTDYDESLVSSVYNVLFDHAQSNTLKQFQIRFGDIQAFLNDQGIPFLYHKDTHQDMLFSPWSLSQLSEKLGMGAAGYLRKCLKEDMPELVTENLNRWIRKNDGKTVILRTHEDRAVATPPDSRPPTRLRAVVSDRYGFFDHVDVIGSIRDVLGQHSELKVESSLFTPDNMMLRLIDPNTVVLPQSDRAYGSYVGVNIRNGQTGQVSVVIEFMIYTIICSNGMFVGEDRGRVFYRKHYGIDRPTFRSDFSRSLEKFPEYVEAAHRTVDEARQIRLSAVFPLNNGLKDFVQRITPLNDEQYDAVESIMVADWDESLWGLSGAVTQYAQTVRNAHEQYKLEHLAGKIVEHGLRLAS